MIRAGAYIIGCSLRNRARRWIKRLREPRYLIAVLAGIGYFYFVLRAQRGFRSPGPAGGRRQRSLEELFPALALVGPSLAGLGVLVVAAGSWLFPGTGTLIDFSRAEVQFLFPAPTSTRKLIVYRMMRSQFGVLVGALVIGLFAPFAGATTTRLKTVVTIWICLFTARVYASGVAISRERLSADDPRTRLAARLPLVIIVGALFVAVTPLVRALFGGGPIAGINDWLSRVVDALSSGPAQTALWPFVALVQPMFAGNSTEFVRSLGVAAGISAVACAWLLLNDKTFDQLTREAADKRKDQPLRKKASYRARRIPWTLAPVGRPELAFAWKGLVQTLRVVEVRVLIRLTLVVAWIGFVASVSSRGASATLGVFAMIVAGISAVLGPLVLRIDLRQDLQHLEVLKTWPVRAAALVRGEMVWPVALLTTVVWLMTALALYVSTAVFSTASLALRASVAIAVCAIAPSLIAAQVAMHNALALMFPAWVSFGVWRARGVDAVGQRLILVGGTVVLVALAAAPGAIIGGIIWFAFNRLIGPVVLVPAGVVCSLVIGLEVLLVTEAIGPAYERLDLTSIERTDT